MESDLQTIQRLRQVYYTTYALFPMTNLVPGVDMAFATDRLVLYRWSGAAWQAMTIHTSSGVIGNIPAAATVPEGSLYYATDESKLYQQQGGAWVLITAFLTYNELDGSVAHMQVANNVWEDWDLSATIPIGTKAIDVHAISGLNNAGIRKNGSALNRMNGFSYVYALCQPDAVRVVETYSITGVSFALVGYWL